MKPEKIESFVERMAGKENLTGQAARLKKLRFGLKDFGDPNVFDCDDRAEIARRIAVEHGYEAKTAIQYSKHGRVAHRYLIVTDKDGDNFNIFKKDADY